MHTRLGKLLRAKQKTPGHSWKVVGLGLRNPWRFSFDSATDNLWIGDVGQDTWEEVDFRAAAKLDRLANYGWSRYEGYSVYSSSHRYASVGAKVKPVVVYSHAHGCSVTGGFVYRGPAVRARRAGGTSTATTAPGRSGASGSASTAVPPLRPSRAACRRSPPSASTGTASCTPSRSAGRSTSSVEWVTWTNAVPFCFVASAAPRRGGSARRLREQRPDARRRGRAQDRRGLESRLDALRLGRAPLERRPARDRDHRGERRARCVASRFTCRAPSTPPRSTSTA